MREVARGDKQRKFADCEAQISGAFIPLTALICAVQSADSLMQCFSPQATSRTIRLFLFPVVQGITLIHFFYGKDSAVQKSAFFFTINLLGRETPCKRHKLVLSLTMMALLSVYH